MQDNITPVATDIYSIVTDKIIEFLEAGTIPWRKPWTDAGLPRNLISMRPYSGVNLLLLNALPYQRNLFLTWKQLKTIGGSVKKGEKGSIVVFSKMVNHRTEKDSETKIEKKTYLRYYKVFNIAQCKDIPNAFISVTEKTDMEPLVECERIIAGMINCPLIRHEGSEAYYEPTRDYINIPSISSFDSSTDYYGTLFHELIHSTGHEKRIGRKEVYQNPNFGTDMYSMEELVAEMGSCYLKSHSGIPIEELANSAAYIEGWLDVFKGDKRFIVTASSWAQQAVEYILNALERKEESEQLVLGIENNEDKIERAPIPN